MSGPMIWLRVLRKRDCERWYLFHPSGAVLAEMLIEALSSSSGKYTAWECWWRRVFASTTELGFETTDRTIIGHARDAREARAKILVDLRNVDRLPVAQQLPVEPIVRESWRVRRAKKRAAKRLAQVKR